MNPLITDLRGPRFVALFKPLFPESSMSPFFWHYGGTVASDGPSLYYLVLLAILVGSIPFAYSIPTDPELKDRHFSRKMFLAVSMAIVFVTGLALWGQGIERGKYEAAHSSGTGL